MNKYANDHMSGTQGAASTAFVVGMIKRDDELRARHVPDHKAKKPRGNIRANVAMELALPTDEGASFIGFDGDYTHPSVNHSKDE